MVPSALQVPISGSSPTPAASVCESPADAPIFFSIPPAKKARYWLSGDQNGYAASSVPAKTVACCESRGRSQSLFTPFSSTPENANVLPSGDTATGPTSKPPEARNAVPGGGGMYASPESDGERDHWAGKYIPRAAR